MARALDHIVHAVRDLDAAADLYRRLGFTVGARNRHPWGTHNHIVQFPGFFTELLTLAAPTMRFEREGKRPDGATVTVGFSLTFAEDKAAPNIHFTTCQQHYPENFWNPAFQRHANTAAGIAGVVAV